MKRLLVKISLIMFSLKQFGRKRKEFIITVNVKNVVNQIHIIIGAEHATLFVSEKVLTNRRQAIKRLMILFKILKFMHGNRI